LKQIEPTRVVNHGWGKVILFVAATAAAWFWLDHMDRGVTWLKVEAPRQAVAGERLPVRVHVAGLKEPTFLCVDLHWSSSRDDSQGFLASGGAKPVGREGGSFDFEITVRATNDLRFVNGILFFSPSASWTDQTFAAATDLIPVTSGREGVRPMLARLPVRQLLEGGGRENAHPAVIPRLLTGLLLLAAAALVWMRFRSLSNITETWCAERRWWLVLTVALALAGIWEWFGLENRVGFQVRAWARAEDVYYPRALFQKGIISATLAATLVFLGFLWRERRPHRVALFSFGLYFIFSVINLLSFHSIDKYAGLSWQGVTLIEALKFVCAAATLVGVWTGCGRRTRQNTRSDTSRLQKRWP
jgi:hypothetical protein